MTFTSKIGFTVCENGTVTKAENSTMIGKNCTVPLTPE